MNLSDENVFHYLGPANVDFLFLEELLVVKTGFFLGFPGFKYIFYL